MIWSVSRQTMFIMLTIISSAQSLVQAHSQWKLLKYDPHYFPVIICSIASIFWRKSRFTGWGWKRIRFWNSIENSCLKLILILLNAWWLASWKGHKIFQTDLEANSIVVLGFPWMEVWNNGCGLDLSGLCSSLLEMIKKDAFYYLHVQQEILENPGEV